MPSDGAREKGDKHSFIEFRPLPGRRRRRKDLQSLD
jgi:hypothetical protein